MLLSTPVTARNRLHMSHKLPAKDACSASHRHHPSFLMHRSSSCRSAKRRCIVVLDLLGVEVAGEYVFGKRMNSNDGKEAGGLFRHVQLEPGRPRTRSRCFAALRSASAAGATIARRNAAKIAAALTARLNGQGGKGHIAVQSIQGLRVADLHHKRKKKLPRDECRTGCADCSHWQT